MYIYKFDCESIHLAIVAKEIYHTLDHQLYTKTSICFIDKLVFVMCLVQCWQIWSQKADCGLRVYLFLISYHAYIDVNERTNEKHTLSNTCKTL